MICQNCGRIIGDESKFCMYCGQSVNQENEYDIDQNSGFNQNVQSMQNDYLNSHLYQDSVGQNPKKKNKKLNRILWGILIVLLITGVAVNHTSNSDQKELTVDETEQPIENNGSDILMCEPDSLTQTNNIMNGGRMAVGNDHFYYLNEDDSIIQCNLDMSDPIVIAGDCSMYLNVYNDSLIYCDKDYAIHQIDLDTGYNSVLIDTACYYTTIYDDYIYYQNDPDGESIYRFNLTDGTNTKINDTQSYNIYIDDQQLYYSTQEAIYRMDLNSQETEKLVDGHAYSYTVYNENTIFYLDDEDLYLHYYNLDTNEDTILLDVEIYEYIYNDDKIYFRASSDYSNQLGYYDLTTMETYSFGVQGQYIQSSGQYLLYYDANKQPNLIDVSKNTNTQLDSSNDGQTL